MSVSLLRPNSMFIWSMHFKKVFIFQLLFTAYCLSPLLGSILAWGQQSHNNKCPISWVVADLSPTHRLYCCWPSICVLSSHTKHTHTHEHTLQHALFQLIVGVWPKPGTNYFLCNWLVYHLPWYSGILTQSFLFSPLDLCFLSFLSMYTFKYELLWIFCVWKYKLHSHFGQSIHALEDILGQRLKIVVSKTPGQQKGKKMINIGIELWALNYK